MSRQATPAPGAPEAAPRGIKFPISTRACHPAERGVECHPNGKRLPGCVSRVMR